MRVRVYPADRFGCGHYRLIWPAEVLALQGLDVEVVWPKEKTGIMGLQIGGEVAGVTAPDCDVAVFQRPARRMVADFIPRLRAKGVAVVVDMDDDLERIHPSNPAWAGMHPRRSPDYNWEHARRACRAATMVTVSTPALAERYGPARVLRNMIPAYAVGLPHPTTLATAGWAGSLHSHPGDLDLAAGALQRLWHDGRALQFIGPDEGVSKLLGVPAEAAGFTGKLDFSEWHAAIASRLGVGVAPLADTSFNESKSWLKPLEYAAAGVPWVGSPTPEYERLAGLTGGLLAAKPKDWYRLVREIVCDASLREALSGMARDGAAGLTYEANAHLWAEAWREALDTQRMTTRTEV